MPLHAMKYGGTASFRTIKPLRPTPRFIAALVLQSVCGQVQGPSMTKSCEPNARASNDWQTSESSQSGDMDCQRPVVASVR